MIPEDAKLFGELYIDNKGEAHFICSNKGAGFIEVRKAYELFIKLLQEKLDSEKSCPFYKETINE